MGFWVFILLFAVGHCMPADPIDRTNLQAAMDDMIMRSYHGFVILPTFLHSSIPQSLQTTDMTFFMPTDQELSEAAVTPDHLQEFILSHSIPTALHLRHLLSLPSGYLVPSNIPRKVITITNSRTSGLFLNNAKIVTPDVCVSSTIRCHGISTAMTFDDNMNTPLTLPINLRPPEFTVSSKKDDKASPDTDLKKIPTQH